jgi:hypothetical protein
MATTTNYGWEIPDDTDLVKDGAASIRELGQDIDTTVFGLSTGALTLVSATTIGTAVSSVNVTSAFSADYDAYKILISGGVASTGVNMTFKLGASTVSYSYIYMGVNSGGAITVNRTTSGSSFALTGGGDTNFIHLNLDIVNPFLANYSAISAPFATENSTGFMLLGTHKVATSYTDFTVAPSSGTLTGGKIYVYGYGV